jgi:hypothetical protein
LRDTSVNSELTETARALAATHDRSLGSTRLFAAALLLRQALEEAIDQVWAEVAPGMEAVTMRAQLIALPFFLPGTGCQRSATGTLSSWRRLARRSSACVTWWRLLAPEQDDD